MTSREMILTFNDDIEPSSVNVSGITIQSTVGVITNTSLYYRLTSAQSISVEMHMNTVTIVRIMLSDVDFNAFQSRLGVATSLSNTFLTMDPTTATDRSARRNMAQPIRAVDAQLVSTYFEDILPPTLHEFSLDLNSGTMTLTFSESVLTGSFSPQHIVISSHQNSTVGASYRLTGGYISNSSILTLSVLEIFLSFSDVVSLKLNRDIATGVNNTYLSVSTGLVTDTNHNTNTISNGVRVSRFTPDTTPPELVAFDFDLNRGVIVLTFNDPINASSLNAAAITLQSSLVLPNDQHSVSNQSFTSSPDGLVIVVHLSSFDLNIMKYFFTVCSAILNCYITLTPFVASDLNGLQTVPISNGSALSVTTFTADRTSPVLLSWELDMDSAALTLIFSESVNGFTADPTQLTLQSTSEVNGFTEAISLTDSSISMIPFSGALIRLSRNDLNAIKRFTNLGTESRNSFLSFSARFISDMSGNRVVPIPSSMAVPVESFTADTTPPLVLDFSINITSGVLSLTFDETVNISSFDFTGLTLLNRPLMNVNGELQRVSNYTLTSGSLQSGFNDPVVVFALTQHDLDAIIAVDGLATSVNSTYLAATSHTVLDMAQNQLVPLPSIHPLRVAAYYGTYGRFAQTRHTKFMLSYNHSCTCSN